MKLFTKKYKIINKTINSKTATLITAKEFTEVGFDTYKIESTTSEIHRGNVRNKKQTFIRAFAQIEDTNDSIDYFSIKLQYLDDISNSSYLKIYSMVFEEIKISFTEGLWVDTYVAIGHVNMLYALNDYEIIKQIKSNNSTLVNIYIIMHKKVYELYSDNKEYFSIKPIKVQLHKEKFVFDYISIKTDGRLKDKEIAIDISEKLKKIKDKIETFDEIYKILTSIPIDINHNIIDMIRMFFEDYFIVKFYDYLKYQNRTYTSQIININDISRTYEFKSLHLKYKELELHVTIECDENNNLFFNVNHKNNPRGLIRYIESYKNNDLSPEEKTLFVKLIKILS